MDPGTARLGQQQRYLSNLQQPVKVGGRIFWGLRCILDSLEACKGDQAEIRHVHLKHAFFRPIPPCPCNLLTPVFFVVPWRYTTAEFKKCKGVGSPGKLLDLSSTPNFGKPPYIRRVIPYEQIPSPHSKLLELWQVHI